MEGEEKWGIGEVNEKRRNVEWIYLHGRHVTEFLTKSCMFALASSLGHSKILSRSCGEKLGEGLVPLLRHGPEMVDSVST